MKYQEKEKMLHILAGVDLLTSEAKEPVSIVNLAGLLNDIPTSTVYSQVKRAQSHGLLNLSTIDKKDCASITLNGYRLLEKEPAVEVQVSKESTPLLTYKQAFRIVCELYVSSQSALSSQRREVVESLINLIEQDNGNQ